MLKFKYRGIVEVEQISEDPEMFVITKVEHTIAMGKHIDIQELKKHYTPVSGDALMLVDPDRNERLCSPLINSPTKIGT